MTSSGTYAYSPSNSDLVLNAFAQIQLRRTELTTHHLVDASTAFNLLMVDFSNRNPHRFMLETQSQVLTPGTASYILTNRTLAISIAYIDITVGSDTVSRVIGPISATEYAAIPNKGLQAVPTSYWFNLQATPTVTLWPTPDSNATYTLKMVTFRQSQDVGLAGGETLDSPYRFLDALSTGLAARLAQMYRPEQVQALDAKYEQRINLAASRDQENVPLRIIPGMFSYYR